MPVLLDLVGQKVNRLFVIEAIDRPSFSRKREKWYRVRCECGSVKNMPSSSLRGGTKSCGCARNQDPHNKLPNGEAAAREVERQMIRSAKERGLTWCLSRDDFRRITSSPCHYCDTPPSQERVRAREESFNGIYLHSGIDRVDSEFGYSLNNVVPCCRFCNNAKGSMSLDEFRGWIKRVHKRLGAIDAEA